MVAACYLMGIALVVTSSSSPDCPRRSPVAVRDHPHP